MEQKASPPFPFAGISCLLLGGLLLMSGGFRFGNVMVIFGVAWAALALYLKLRRR